MSPHQKLPIAPELQVTQWLNSKEPITLKSLRGKVVVIEAFQMLCPGCVSHGLPQAQKIASLFPPDKVTVMGLHTVFEHHEPMTPVSLKAFIHEYRLKFPIGVDEPGAGGMPNTMAAYQMRGTPSLIMIDQKGFLRVNLIGHVHDILVGAKIATLLAEADSLKLQDKREDNDGGDENGCPVPDNV